MSKHSSYEDIDQQFNDLPLPDQETSWRKMKELLDEDDDDDRILPPILLRSCMGWGILLLVGLTVTWLLVRPEKWWSENSKAKQNSSSNIPVQTITKTTSPEKKESISKPLSKETKPEVVTIPKQNENNLLPKPTVVHQTDINISSNTIPGKTKSYKPKKQRHVFQKEDLVQPRAVEINVSVTANENNKNKRFDSSAVTNQQKVSPVKDSVNKENTTQSKDATIHKKANLQQKKFFFTAGIGEQQQIPIAGQTAVPYSQYGRKGSLSDYIPSVYIRLQNEQKWFIQGEFRYGAAQSVREFSYSRQTKLDTLGNNLTTTTMRLKKTYYHQLPLSFNYYLNPNLLIGVGGIYSRFCGAITEQEIKIQNIPTQTETVFKQIIPIKHFTDSFLYKTQVHLLLQAGYQWRKFTFGLRYTRDIQPYIKYTKPDGTINEEKNQSLQFIIQYRLWQSKKFY
jgi:hypothetical protein